jgi:hypothetical protein
MPVVLLWHDQNAAQYLARNLQDFLFHMLLGSMADQDTYNAVSDDEFREQLASMLGTHARYLTARQADAASLAGQGHHRLRGGAAERTQASASRPADDMNWPACAGIIPYEKFDSDFAYGAAG